MRERFEQHVGERACKQGSEQASKHAAEKDEGKLKRLECWDPSLLAQKKSGFTVLPSSADAETKNGMHMMCLQRKQIWHRERLTVRYICSCRKVHPKIAALPRLAFHHEE